MPTYDEVVAQLTGPGAPFEIVTETVGRSPDEELEEPRALDAREDRERRPARRRDRMVHGERRISYGEFARLVWGTARGAARRARAAHAATASAILAYNSPDWLIALFGATSARRHRRRAQRLVGDRGDRVRARAIRAAASWSSTSGCGRASSRCVGKIPSLEKIFYIGAQSAARARCRSPS